MLAQLPLLGDYAHTGLPRTANDHLDISELVEVLGYIHARDFMHQVWNLQNHAWCDFSKMAEAFLNFQIQKNRQLRLWLYLTPPQEGASLPFGTDYIKWAVECAKVAKTYPVVAGLCIDDFNYAQDQKCRNGRGIDDCKGALFINKDKYVPASYVPCFTPDYCKEMMNAARKIAPWMRLFVVFYYVDGAMSTIVPYVEQGAIDGVIFPYLYDYDKPNLIDTTRLLPQIQSYRKLLDDHSPKNSRFPKMPLVVMIYATGREEDPAKAPTPQYVETCLSIGLEATKKGLANGVVTYALNKGKDPKASIPYLNAVAQLYKEWNP